MRVLIWATHLQTDILALAAHLDRVPGVAMLIVVPGADRFRRTALARARPFQAPVIDRADPRLSAWLAAFGADVVVADNHIPPPGSAPRLLYMWHGLGWKARSQLDLRVFCLQVKRLTGIDPRTPNSRFRAQCYGPTDRAWRIEKWGLPPSACVTTGMAFADLIDDAPLKRTELAKHYRIDVMNRHTVLLSVTWHYGGIFAQRPGTGRTLASLFGRGASSPRDLEFVRGLIDKVREHGANLLICLHDRHRYDPDFIAELEAIEADEPLVEMRFKDEHPDNMSDLLVADVMLSNLSSFISYFYLLGRPAIHILPGDPSGVIERTTMLLSRIRLRRRVSADRAWMIDPHDTGGVLIMNTDDAKKELDAALRNPDLHTRAAADWLDRHLPIRDGRACERLTTELERLCLASLPTRKSVSPGSTDIRFVERYRRSGSSAEGQLRS